MVNWFLVVLSVLSLLTLLLVLLMLPCLIIVIVIIVIIAVFGSRCLVCTGNNDMNAEGLPNMYYSVRFYFWSLSVPSLITV